jgi:hypothetical protein
MAKVIITAGGSIATRDLLAIYFRGDGYMLANRETENITWLWKSKAIPEFLVNTAGANEGKRRTWRCLGK